MHHRVRYHTSTPTAAMRMLMPRSTSTVPVRLKGGGVLISRGTLAWSVSFGNLRMKPRP